MRSLTCDGEFAQDFADDGAEFEGMTGTATRKYNVLVFGVFVDDPMLVGGHRVKTDASRP